MIRLLIFNKAGSLSPLYYFIKFQVLPCVLHLCKSGNQQSSCGENKAQTLISSRTKSLSAFQSFVGLRHCHWAASSFDSSQTNQALLLTPQVPTSTRAHASGSPVTWPCVWLPVANSTAPCATQVPARRWSSGSTWRANSTRAKCPSSATGTRWRTWATSNDAPPSVVVCN